MAAIDADGSVVGDTLANTNHLGAGETWNFEVPILTTDAVRYRVEKLRWTHKDHDVMIGPDRIREISAR